jgi:hypothetical protein
MRRLAHDMGAEQAGLPCGNPCRPQRVRLGARKKIRPPERARGGLAEA